MDKITKDYYTFFGVCAAPPIKKPSAGEALQKENAFIWLRSGVGYRGKFRQCRIRHRISGSGFRSL